MAQYDIDLRDYWRIIKKRKPIIVFSMITMLMFSFIFANYKKSRVINIYASSTTIRIDKDQKTQDLLMTPFATTDDIATDIKTITSFPVMADVALRMGYFPDSLKTLPDSVKYNVIQGDPILLRTVNQITSMVGTERYEYTNIVSILTRDTDPVAARNLAQSVAESYKEIRKRSANQRIANSIAYIKNQLANIDNEMAGVKASIDSLQKTQAVLPIYTGNAMTNEMSDVNRRKDEVAFRRKSTESLIADIEKNGTIDDSAFSNAFVEDEGGIFRENYRALQNLYSQRDEKRRYLTEEHPDIKQLNEKIEDQKKLIMSQLKSNITALSSKENNYDIRLSELRDRYDQANKNSDSVKRYEDQLQLLGERYLYMTGKLQDFEIKGSENIDEVTITEPAVINPNPINETSAVATISFIGLFLGTIIGLTAAFIFEALDTSIGTIEDVETYLNVPVIGLIPQIGADIIKGNLYTADGKRKHDYDINNDQAMLVIHYAPKSILAESYRSMRTNIQFISYEKEAKVLVFTSTQAREGKTTSIVNLALTMAQSGNHVLLIDADLRRPSIDSLFGIERENGMSEIVLGKRHWKECVKTVADIITGKLGMSDIILEPGIDNLHIITCGAIPPNPSELLNSENTDEFIRSVRNEYDIVLFDCAPTLPATDSAVLGRKVDGVVFVYAVGRVSRASLKRAKNQMDNVKAQVIGIVLNGIRSDMSADFHDYKYKENYYYSYTEEDIQEQQSRLGKVKRFVEDFINRFV